VSSMVQNWLQRIFYRALIAGALAEKDGVIFEDWFVELARRAWGQDFEPVRAQGKHGDLKCDGHRISEGGIYQCYAPLRPVREKIEDKIQTDFSGALAIWKEKMKSWQIVINDRQGLQSEAKTQVEILRTKNHSILIQTFGPIEIEKLALTLSEVDLGDLFNVSFGGKEAELMRVSFNEIGSLVDLVGNSTPLPSFAALDPPSKDKAALNKLDDEIVTLLTRGQVLAQRVEQYFNDSGKVDQGEKIGHQFSRIYLDMKEAGWDSTRIFYEFIDICGGLKHQQGRRMAVLAVVTYYFNKCDIFENLTLVTS
jgi:hypothetical protein